LPQTGNAGLALVPWLRQRLMEHRAYIRKHGQDLPEIRDWQWSPRRVPAACD